MLGITWASMYVPRISSCEKTLIEPRHANWWVHRNLAEDKSTLEIIKDDGKYRIEEIDLEVRSKTLEWYSYQGDNFDSVRGETLWDMTFGRRDWQVRTITRTILTSSTTHFRIQAELDAYENDSRVFSKSWDSCVPRNLV